MKRIEQQHFVPRGAHTRGGSSTAGCPIPAATSKTDLRQRLRVSKPRETLLSVPVRAASFHSQGAARLRVLLRAR